MDVFITIVLIVFLVVWLLGKLLPRILVWALNRRIRKMGDQYAQANNNYKEGEVVIQQKREEKIMDDTIGEYIDFEETKE